MGRISSVRELTAVPSNEHIADGGGISARDRGTVAARAIGPGLIRYPVLTEGGLGAGLIRYPAITEGGLGAGLICYSVLTMREIGRGSDPLPGDH